MTGTFPKNAGSTSPGAPKKARPLCGNPRRSFHFFGPSRSPLASHGWPGRFPGSTEFVRDRTQTRRKLRVQGGQVALCRAQPIPLGEPWLAGAFPGFTKFVRDRTQTRRKLRVQGGQVARFPAKPEFSAPPLESSEKSTFMAGPRDR